MLRITRPYAGACGVYLLVLNWAVISGCRGCEDGTAADGGTSVTPPARPDGAGAASSTVSAPNTPVTVGLTRDGGAPIGAMRPPDRTPACGNCTFDPTYDVPNHIGRLTVELQPFVTAGTGAGYDKGLPWTVTRVMIQRASTLGSIDYNAVSPPLMQQTSCSDAGTVTQNINLAVNSIPSWVSSGDIASVDVEMYSGADGGGGNFVRKCIKIKVNGEFIQPENDCPCCTCEFCPDTCGL